MDDWGETYLDMAPTYQRIDPLAVWGLVGWVSRGCGCAETPELCCPVPCQAWKMYFFSQVSAGLTGLASVEPPTAAHQLLRVAQA
jgi:hypothetical protein